MTACDTTRSLLMQPGCLLLILGQGLSVFLNVIIIVGALFVLWNFFHAGLLYITAGDNTEQTKKSRMSMTWSVIGLFGLGSLYALLKFIVDAVPGLNSIIPV